MNKKNIKKIQFSHFFYFKKIKKIGFFLFFFIHLHMYRDAKILPKFREFMWKKEHYEKSWVFFTYLVTKMPNYMRNNLHLGKKKWHFQKSVFLVFLSVICTKVLKSKTITLYVNKTNIYEELAFKCFLNPYIPNR